MPIYHRVFLLQHSPKQPITTPKKHHFLSVQVQPCAFFAHIAIIAHTIFCTPLAIYYYLSSYAYQYLHVIPGYSLSFFVFLFILCLDKILNHCIFRHN